MNYQAAIGYLQRTAVVVAVLGLIGAANIMLAQKPAANRMINTTANAKLSHLAQTNHSATDFTGDQVNDVVLFDAVNAEWTVHSMADNSVQSFTFGAAYGVPVAGDYDGDGVIDIAMVRADDDSWCWELRYSGGETASIDWGLTSDIPVKGDFDGDGRADIAVWRPDAGSWLVLASGSGEVLQFQLGHETDQPVPGDYDGDGRTDVAVFRAETATLYFVGSSDQLRHAQSWEVPVLEYDTSYAPADYDGDGVTDLAIFTEKDGQYRIFQSSTQSYRLLAFPVGPRNCTTFSSEVCSTRDFAQPVDYDNDGVADPAIWNNVSGQLTAYGSQNGLFNTTTETGAGKMTVSAYFTVQ